MYSNIIIKLLITLLATIITLSLFGGISSLISSNNSYYLKKNNPYNTIISPFGSSEKYAVNLFSLAQPRNQDICTLGASRTQINLEIIKKQINSILSSAAMIIKCTPRCTTCRGLGLGTNYFPKDYFLNIFKTLIKQSFKRIALNQNGEQNAAIPVVTIVPNYPRKPLIAKIEGWVKIEFTITATGGVINPHVVSAKPARMFNREALRAISKYRFKPKYVNGTAVEQVATRTIEFKLGEQKKEPITDLNICKNKALFGKSK